MLLTAAANAQTKKVMMEDYTGIHCQYCPDGTVILEDLQSQNPTNCLPVAIHCGIYEPSTSVLNSGTVGAALVTASGLTGYPAGAVDRKIVSGGAFAQNRGQWAGSFATRSAMTPPVTISFTNLKATSATDYSFDLNVKFTAAPTASVPMVANVYVIEDSIPATGALAQTNEPAGPHGGQNPLQNWYHNRTFRKALSGDAWGYTDIIPASVTVGTTYTKHITFSADASWIHKNMKMVAYVAYNGTAASDQKEIVNAEQANLGAVWPTSVANVTNVNITSTYPNPATTTDVINVEYNAEQSGMVTMKVLNAIGQVVATPYNSNEVRGIHTIQWKASEHNLPAGLYFMQVSTASGSAVSKVNIY